MGKPDGFVGPYPYPRLTTQWSDSQAETEVTGGTLLPRCLEALRPLETSPAGQQYRGSYGKEGLRRLTSDQL